MNKNKLILIVMPILLFVLLFFALFIPTKNTQILTAGILVVVLSVLYFLVRKRKTPSFYRREVLLLIVSIGLLYLMGLYLSGIHFGFFKSLKFSFVSLFKVIIPLSVIIISIEIIRNILLSQENKIVEVFTFLSCVVVEVLMYSNLRSINSLNGFMDIVGLTFFPAITHNILYNYLSKRYGIYPNIVFRLITSLYPYVIPYVPATPDSLLAFLRLMLPLLIYAFISGLYEGKAKFAVEKTSKMTYVITSLLILMMISVAMLISGQFKVGTIVIGSESMTGELNKGDVVFYEKFSDQLIEEEQIIVFKKGESLIIHRVTKIEIINNQVRYYTKGDTNEDDDEGYITNKEIIGITKFKIPYLGYPTIWINDLY